MKLADKGPICPPPDMPGLLGRVAGEIGRWPGVVAATHWHLQHPGRVDGADFYLGEAEIGHLHLDGEAHVATDASLSQTFTGRGLAQPFRYRADPAYRHWTQISIADDTQARHAVELFRANFERLRDAGFG